jgi:DeoR family fructose operon transcriptional repressor
MLAELRRLRIAEYIRQREGGVMSVAELSQLLAVSEMTIRRDLVLLESKSILRRIHGAIAYRHWGDKPFSDRQPAIPQKKVIGWLAAQLVKDGDRIILDAGTTTMQVAYNLTRKNRLTVITNNIPISSAPPVLISPSYCLGCHISSCASRRYGQTGAFPFICG